MKLYNREEFLKLPRGTIYSDPSNVDLLQGLYCKMSDERDGYTNDWVVQDLLSESGFPNDIVDVWDAFQYVVNLRDTYQEFRTDLDCGGRDGMFEDTDKFVVWDDEDVDKLVYFLLNRHNL